MQLFSLVNYAHMRDEWLHTDEAQVWFFDHWPLWLQLFVVSMVTLLILIAVCVCWCGPKTFRIDPIDFTLDASATSVEGEQGLKIIVLTIGTRGDVQPFVGLCKALKAAGHHPQIASHGYFKTWVEQEGVQFKDIGSERINQPEEWLTATSIKDFFMAMKPEMVKSKIACERFYAESLGMDILIATSHTVSFGLDISEKLGIPCYCVKLAPDLPTKAFGPFSTESSQYGWVNLFNHYKFLVDVAAAYKEAEMDQMEDEFRKKVLGLPDSIGLRRLSELRDMPTIVAVGKDIIPNPHWQRNVGICGWIFLDQHDFKPPEKVVRFLKGPGGPPVCVNFGSMVLASEADIILNAVKAARGAGYRVLLITGWGKVPDCDLFDDEDNCCLIEGLPHEWIFPQCRCIIHHGGAGTMARALQAGVPSVVVPILKWADQRFWARRSEAAHCGVHVPDPTVSSLRGGVEMVSTSKLIRDGCCVMKEKIRKEDGLKNAVRMIEQAWRWSQKEMAGR